MGKHGKKQVKEKFYIGKRLESVKMKIYLKKTGFVFKIR